MPRVPKKELPPLITSEETIGQRIGRYRKTRGLTQQQLGELIGIDQNLVSDYERGRIRLYDEMLGRFAVALKVSADILLGLDTDAGMGPDVSLRFHKRLAVIETFPESKKKHILRLLDDVIKANSFEPIEP